MQIYIGINLLISFIISSFLMVGLIPLYPDNCRVNKISNNNGTNLRYTVNLYSENCDKNVDVSIRNEEDLPINDEVLCFTRMTCLHTSLDDFAILWSISFLLILPLWIIIFGLITVIEQYLGFDPFKDVIIFKKYNVSEN